MLYLSPARPHGSAVAAWIVFELDNWQAHQMLDWFHVVTTHATSHNMVEAVFRMPANHRCLLFDEWDKLPQLSPSRSEYAPIVINDLPGEPTGRCWPAQTVLFRVREPHKHECCSLEITAAHCRGYVTTSMFSPGLLERAAVSTITGNGTIPTVIS